MNLHCVLATDDGISASASFTSLTPAIAESGVILQEGKNHLTWDGAQFTPTIDR